MRLEATLIRKAFLYLAPLALVLAAWWMPLVDPVPRFGLTMDRQEAMEAARSFAASRGVDTSGWQGEIDLVREERLERLLRLRRDELPVAVEEIRNWAPPIFLRVQLSHVAGTSDLQVNLAPDGQILGWDLSRAGELASIRPESSPEDMARQVLLQQLGTGNSERWQLLESSKKAEQSELEELEETGETEDEDSPTEKPSTTGPEAIDPESSDSQSQSEKFTVVTSMTPAVASEGLSLPAVSAPAEAVDPSEVEDSTGASIEEYRFQDLVPSLAEVELEPKVTMRGGREVAYSMGVSISDDADVPALSRGDGSVVVRVGAVFLLFGVGIISLFWGLWRYWHRLQETEVSHGRTLSLGLLVAGLAGLTLYYLLAGEGTLNLGDGAIQGAGASALAAIGVGLFLLPLGLLLGAVWSGCEGDVREIFAEKLVSLDALLAGRWWSRNLGRAILTGAACAAWVMLLRVLLLFPWLSQPEAGPDQAVGLFLRHHPWQFSIAQGLALLIPYSTLGLLAPLSLLRRWTRSRARTLPLLAGILWMTCLMTPAVSQHWPFAASLVAAAVWTAAFLGPFFAFDFLTAAVSFVLSLFFLHGLHFAYQPSSALQHSAAIAGAGLSLVLCLAALVWRRGREVTVEEVRPGYARNILERMALSAELTAAEQARARMLPQAPPEVAGGVWTIEISSHEESEGDYFDFFPLADGSLAFAVANFGRHGLAAAQRLTLAKGFLLSYSRRGLAPTEVIERLSQRLQELVVDPDEIRLAFGLYRPETGRVEVAVDRRPPVVLGYRDSLHEAQLDLVAESSCLDMELKEGDGLGLFLPTQALTPRERARLVAAISKEGPRSATEFSLRLRKKGLPSGTVVWLQQETAE